MYHMPLQPHPALYLLPVLFGILGGVAAWILLRNSGGNMGRNCILVGMASSAVSLAAYVAMGTVIVEPEPPPWNA